MSSKVLMLVWERMVSMFPMTFETCVSEEIDTMFSLRLRLNGFCGRQAITAGCMEERK